LSFFLTRLKFVTTDSIVLDILESFHILDTLSEQSTEILVACTEVGESSLPIISPYHRSALERGLIPPSFLVSDCDLVDLPQRIAIFVQMNELPDRLQRPE
jgi:hypothetical protein